MSFMDDPNKLEIGTTLLLGKEICYLFCQIKKKLVKSLTYLNHKNFICIVQLLERRFFIKEIHMKEC